ncbi:MAG: GntR family transcriptional regulator [Actinomycetota bacterium]|nr:GntR family transcriptional regulator [Actinomycetota bacterium]
MSDPDPIVALQQSPPLRDQVYDALEKLIIEGVLEPGRRLTEGDLAERLGVSRNPVREALNGLSRAGWVELRPRQGAYVRRQTAEEGDQFFQVRRLLEIESARLAARRTTPESVPSLKALLEVGWAALEARDEAALLTANSKFHAEVVALSGNQVLAEILGFLDKRLRWYFSPVVVTRGPDSWREHTDLVDAIAENDRQKAADMMWVHTEGTRLAYLAQAAPGE